MHQRPERLWIVRAYRDTLVARDKSGDLCRVAAIDFVYYHQYRFFVQSQISENRANGISKLVDIRPAGVDYVLTSGHAITALDGAETLRHLQERAETQLTVLAGGRIRGPNVRELVARSHVREVHARCTDPTIVRDVVQALATPVEHIASPNR